MATNKYQKNGLQGTIAATIICAILLITLIWLGNTIAPGIRSTNAHTTKIVAAAQAEPGGIMYLIHYEFVQENIIYSGTINCSTCGTAYAQALNTGYVDLWVDPQDYTNVSVEKSSIGMKVFLNVMYWGAILFILLVYVLYVASLWDIKSSSLFRGSSPDSLKDSAFFINPITATIREPLHGFAANLPVTIPADSNVKVDDVIVGGIYYYVFVTSTPNGEYPQGQYCQVRVEYLQQRGLARKPGPIPV
jgi:hypothetical protein